MKYRLNVKIADFGGKSTWTESWEYETDAPASLEELKNYAEGVISSWNSTTVEEDRRTLVEIESIGLYPGTILDTEGKSPVIGGLDTPDETKVQQDISSIIAFREFLAEEDTEESCVADSVIDWLINPDSDLDLENLKLIVRYGV